MYAVFRRVRVASGLRLGLTRLVILRSGLVDLSG